MNCLSVFKKKIKKIKKKFGKTKVLSKKAYRNI